jgi:rhodanese-related sulfurtransferase
MKMSEVLTHAPKALWVGRGPKSALLFSAASVLVFLSVLSGWVSFASIEGSSKPVVISFIDAPELMSWLEDGRALQLVDARHDRAFDAAHLPGAVSIHRMRVPYDNGKEPMVFYCDRPPVSKFDLCFRAVVAELQKKAGSIYWFKSGVTAWRSQGYPVEKSPQADEA